MTELICTICRKTRPSVSTLGPDQHLFFLQNILELPYQTIASAVDGDVELYVCESCDTKVKKAFYLEKKARQSQLQFRKLKVNVQKLSKGSPGFQRFLQELENGEENEPDENLEPNIGSSVFVKAEPKSPISLQGQSSGDEEDEMNDQGYATTSSHTLSRDPTLGTEETGVDVEIPFIKSEPFLSEESEPFHPEQLEESETFASSSSSRLAYYNQPTSSVPEELTSAYATLSKFGRSSLQSAETLEDSPQLPGMNSAVVMRKKVRKAKKKLEKIPWAVPETVHLFKCKVPDCNKTYRYRSPWVIHTSWCQQRYEETKKRLI